MKTFRYILVLVFAGALFNGCDYIDPPYTQPGANGCDVEEPDFTPRPASDRKRKVLIEDFTGHRCGNCPRAAETIHDVQGAHPGQVVAVGVHSVYAETFTATMPNDISVNPELHYIYDFRRTVSNTIDERFHVSNAGLPKGMVNRVSVSGSPILSYTTWENRTSTLLALPQDIDIQLKPFYDNVDNSLCVYYYAQFLNSISGRYKIVMYLTESHFVTWQKDYSTTPQDIEHYEHNHILRENITTIWGDLLIDGTALGSETYINGYSITVDPAKYNIDNCYVVAFVYDEITNEVIQAEEQKVID